MPIPFAAAARSALPNFRAPSRDDKTPRAVIGFDGFIDEILAVVDTRTSVDDFQPIETIAAFSRRIAAAAGYSTNFELVSRQRKLGGNAPILALGLAVGGLDVTCIGALGTPKVHPAFNELERRARIMSLAQPGHTQALEFSDGKLLMGRIETLDEITWERLVEWVGFEQLVRLYGDADVIGMVNWTMIHGMTDIWHHMAAEIAPHSGSRRPLAFFDLADPSKRTPAEIRAALDALARFRPHWQTYLGLNRKEAAEVGAAIGLQSSTRLGVDLETATRTLAAQLDVTGVVVHPVDKAGVCVGGEYVAVAGPYTPAPRLSTGAGDNFNAGFCHALARGLSLQDALTIGNATSGFYVRHTYSPSHGELREFLSTYANA